jgi:PKD repeat protein
MRNNFTSKKMMMFILLALSSQFIFSQKAIDAYQVEKEGYFIHPVSTTAGIVATDNFASKIYLIQHHKLKELMSTSGCGRYFSVSPDKSKIGFKIINPDGKQIPAIFDLHSMKIQELSSPVNLCGQISFSNNGEVAYTVGNELYVMKDNLFQKYNLNMYSNIAPISPDGNFVVYNNDNDQLFIMNLSTGQVQQITVNGGVYAYPQWSPDGNKISYSTLSGNIMILDKTGGNTYSIGSGENVSWSDNSQYIIFNRTTVENFEYKGSDIYLAKFDGSSITNLTNTPNDNEISPSFGSDHTILYSTFEKKEIMSENFDSQNFQLSNRNRLFRHTSQFLLGNESFVLSEQTKSTKSNVMVSGDVPYVHQVYDTPDWHSGYSSCAPSTSIMALAYYNRLPYWDITCSSPSSHTSHYGSYVADMYRYNGTYYNLTANDYAGNTAWGGYGYMWNGSNSPSSTQATYIQNHNITSVRSSSTTFANVQTEIDNSYPFPICSTITSAGHLTLAVGYVSGQHTLIFNDPYGNKNNGYMNYLGKNSYYDWPGYNNGYQNLNTVAWTTTAEATQLTYNDTIIDDVNYNHGFYINNQGIALMRYYRDSETGGYGAFSHYWWTYTSSSTTVDTCYVKWTPTLPSTAYYHVYAYIPSSGPTSTAARYKIYYNGGNTTTVINQSTHLGQWVSLGIFPFVQGSTGYVRLGDGAGVQSQVIAFDAMKWNKVPAPIANFNATPTSFCLGSSVQFTNSSSNATSYSWTFNGGTPATSTQTNPSVVYSTPGTYTVTLIANGDGGTNTLTRTNYITVYALPELIVSSNTPLCSGQDIQLTASSASSYVWSGPNGYSSNAQNPLIPNAQTSYTGTYSITITDANGCSNTASSTITVNALPTITITAIPETICSGTSSTLTANGGISYSWDNGLGMGNNLIVFPTSTTAYHVTGTDANGCSDTAESITVTVIPLPTASFSYNSSNMQVVFTNTSQNSTSWLWNFGDGNTDNTQNPTYNYANANTYTVTLISYNSCGSDTTTQNIIVTAITSTSADASINAYPNPNNGMFELNISSPYCGTITVTVYDIEGRKIFSHDVQKNSSSIQLPLDLKNATKGVYHITIMMGNNAVHATMVIDKP